MLLNWLNCYLSGRHDYGVTCAAGSIFLRCIHCGKRSNGWAVHDEQTLLARPRMAVQPQPNLARALPFRRRDVVRRQRPA